MSQIVSAGEEEFEFPDDMDEASIKEALNNHFRGVDQKAQGNLQQADFNLGQSIENTTGLPVGDAYTSGKEFLVDLKDAFTGRKKKVKETEDMKDWQYLPELNEFKSLFSGLSNLSTSAATMSSSPKQIAELFAEKYPQVKMRQDKKGNYIFTSAVDGNDYSIKPGMDAFDMVRMFTTGAAYYTPGGATAGIGKVIAKDLATTAAIEGHKVFEGAEFNPREVGANMVADIAMPGALSLPESVKKGYQAIPSMRYGKTLADETMDSAKANAVANAQGLTSSKIQPKAQALINQQVGDGGLTLDPSIPRAPDETLNQFDVPASVAPSEPIIDVPTASMQDIGSASKKATKKGKKAVQEFADLSAQDPKIIQDAKDLGIDGYLQSDHTTTSQAYREIQQVLKSKTGSLAHAEEVKGLQKIGEVAKQIVRDLGGTPDTSIVNKNLKDKFESIVGQIDAKESKAWDKINEKIPKQHRATPQNTIDYIEGQIDAKEGIDNLSAIEKEVYQKLKREGGEVSSVREGLQSSEPWNKDSIKDALEDSQSAIGEEEWKKAVGEFDSPDELADNIFYHGSGRGAIGELKPSILFEEGFQGGGGYGENYWGISLSKDKNIASNFSGEASAYNVAPVMLKKGSKVKDLPDVEDAVEIGDMVEELWNEGVDAVRIGDFSGGEKELLVLNPKALVTGINESGKVFGKERLENISKEAIEGMFDAKQTPSAIDAPKYTLSESLRKKVGIMVKKGQHETSEAIGDIKQLYAKMKLDQKDVVDSFGLEKEQKIADLYTMAGKGMTDDMKSIYGKKIDKSLVQPLLTGIGKLRKGDISNFVNLMKTIPRSKRAEVTASGIFSAFGEATKNGNLNFNTYAKWFKGVKENSQAYAALKANLPKGGMEKFEKLANVANGIKLATAEFITTGKIQEAARFMEQTEGFIAKGWDVTKKAGSIGLAAEAAGWASGMPMMGGVAGMTSAGIMTLMQAKKDVIEAVDKLVTTQQFKDAVVLSVENTITPQAAKRLADTPAFKRYAKAMGLPKNHQGFILSALKGAKQVQQDETSTQEKEK